MILRYGSAVVVEVAPKTSNFDLFLIFEGNYEQTFVVLHSIQKYSSCVPSYTRQNKIWDPEQQCCYGRTGKNIHGRSKKGHMRKFDIKSEEASPEHPWMRRISLIILQNKSSRIQETFHKAGWGSPTFVLGGSFTPPLGIATLPSIGVNPSGQTPLGGPEIVSLRWQNLFMAFFE